jgi:outer membrane lipoprotein
MINPLIYACRAGRLYPTDRPRILPAQDQLAKRKPLIGLSPSFYPSLHKGEGFGERVRPKLIRSNGVVLLLLILLPGCAAVISKSLRAQVDLSLHFSEAFQNPKAYEGKIVIWGGEVIKTINQKDGTTLVEVLQRPLNRMEEPEVTKPPGGRFLMLSQKYLNSFILREGTRITIAGEILGERSMPLGEMEYRYPLILSREMYLWEYHFYYPSQYYPRGHFYFPWWWYFP